VADELEPADAAFAVLLSDALDAPLPPGLAARVDAAVASVGAASARRWLVVRGVAAAFAMTLFINGMGNFTRVEWVARHLHEPVSRHAANEGGAALLALSVLFVLAALRPRLLSTAAAVAGPLGLYFGVAGVREVGTFLDGGILHLSEAMLGLGLVALWFWARRYVSRPSDEGGA
jgi:hypothetical protein